MSSQSVAPSRMMYVVREALDGVASPQMRDEILERALFVANVPTVPVMGTELRDFVKLYLGPAIAAVLSEAEADHVIAHLEPIVRMAESDDGVSDVHPTAALLEKLVEYPSDVPTEAPPEIGPDSDLPLVPRPASVPVGLFGESASGVKPVGDLEWQRSPHESNPTMPAPQSLPVVLVASELREVSNAVRQSLGGRVIVRHVTDSIALLDALQSSDQVAQLLVVDGGQPAIQPATLAGMATDVPDETIVMLWNVETNAALSELLDTRAEWLECATEDELEDVARACAELLGVGD